MSFLKREPIGPESGDWNGPRQQETEVWAGPTPEAKSEAASNAAKPLGNIIVQQSVEMPQQITVTQGQAEAQSAELVGAKH